MGIQETVEQLVQHRFQAIIHKQTRDVLVKVVKARAPINIIYHF